MRCFTGPYFQWIKGGWGEAAEILSLAVILAIIVRIFVLEPFFIPSLSMSPLLLPGDKILVYKLGYRAGEPKRGDIAVFKFPLDEKKDYIKRIIALPGETIEGRNNTVLINGREIEELYLPEGIKFADFGPVQMNDCEYFFLGDNREDSEDSRFWGPVKESKIKGKAILIYWPLNRFTWQG